MDEQQSKPVCPKCGGTCYIDTPALKFLHEQLHSEPYAIRDLGLRSVPFSLFPRIAKVMQDYADAAREYERTACPESHTEGLEHDESKSLEEQWARLAVREILGEMPAGTPATSIWRRRLWAQIVANGMAQCVTEQVGALRDEIDALRIQAMKGGL